MALAKQAQIFPGNTGECTKLSSRWITKNSNQLGQEVYVVVIHVNGDISTQQLGVTNKQSGDGTLS